METCRLFTKGPQLLHVHDNPGSIADANRCADNGCDVDVFKCQRPDLPSTPGDPNCDCNDCTKRPVVVDVVRRIV